MAVNSGVVTAMHDPTEGGLAGALWELAAACGHTLVIDPHAIAISPLSQKICNAFEIDPLRTIASGALLLTTPHGDAQKICNSLVESGIPCAVIGTVQSGKPGVVQATNEGFIPLPCPARDEIARVFEG
jgi:hydrogenase maturation factor